MSAIDKLSELFSKFPGVGPRQARRFVYFLLRQNQEYRKALAQTILTINDETEECGSCHRFFTLQFSGNKIEEILCDICESQNTNHSVLLVVEKDADFESIRRTEIYRGRYFILGGNIPILEENPSQKIRARALFNEVEKRAQNGSLKEIILAMGATSEGNNTLIYLKKILEPLSKKHSLQISVLGRGLSTGTELEYSDTDTFASALKNRR